MAGVQIVRKHGPKQILELLKPLGTHGSHQGHHKKYHSYHKYQGHRNGTNNITWAAGGAIIAGGRITAV